MKKLLIASMFLVILLICVLLFINSGVFVKRVVIPMAASAIGTEISVEDVDFSIFKGIELINLKVEGKEGQQPPLNADLLRVSYKFSPLLSGKISVDEVVVENASIQLIENKDGTFNIPSGGPTEDTEDTDSAPQETQEEDFVVPDFDIRNVRIDNVSIAYKREATDEKPEVSAEISGISFSLDQLARGKPFVINSQATISGMIGSEVNVRSELCKLALNGTIREDVYPEGLDLKCSMERTSGKAHAFNLDNRIVRFEFNCVGDGKSYKVERCEFSELLGSEVEALASLTGDIGVNPITANLALTTETNGPGFLNVVGGLIGDYNFGKTDIKYSGNVQIQEDLSTVAINGDIKVADFTVSSENLGIDGLDPLNIDFDHAVTYEKEDQLINLQKFDMHVNDKTRELVTLVLSEPTTVSFNEGAPAQDNEATINLEVRDFNLKFFKPLIPASSGVDLQRGLVNKNVKIKVYKGGDQLEIKGKSSISDLTFTLSGQNYSNLGLQNRFSAKIDGFFSKLIVEELAITSLVNDVAAIDINAVASVDLETMTGTAEIAPFIIGPELGTLIPKNLLSDYQIKTISSDGRFKIDLDQGKKVTLSGRLNTDPISIENTRNSKVLSLSPEFHINALYTTNGPLQITQCELNLNSTQGQQGKVALTGEVDINSLEGELALAISDITASLLNASSGLVDMDLNFGDTRLNSRSAITLASKANFLKFNGEFTGHDLTIESQQLGLGPLRPLIFSSSYSGQFNVSDTILDLSTFSLNVDDNDKRVITVVLEKPGTLGLVAEGALSSHEPVGVKVTIDALHLDLVKPFVPEGIHIDLKDSTLNGKLDITIQDLINQLSCAGNMKLEDVSIPGQGNGGASQPSILSTGLDLDLTYRNDGFVTIRNSLIAVRGNEEELLQMNTVGELDITLSGKPSKLSIDSLIPIQAKRLHDIALAVTGTSDLPPESKAGTADQPSKSKAETHSYDDGDSSQYTQADRKEPSTSPILNLDVQVNVNIPEIDYDKIIITDFKPTLQAKDYKVTLSPFTFNLNDGKVQIGASSAYENLDNPTYEGNLEADTLDLQPIFESLFPKYSNLVSGELKSAKMVFDGEGLATDHMMKSLNAKTSCELLNFNCATITQDYEELLNILGIKGNDLIFDSIHVDGQVAESLVEVADLSLYNPNLRVLSEGQLEFGGKWAPNLEVTLGYAGDLEDWAKKKKMKLNQGEDDFFYTEKLPLKMDSWDKKNLLRQWLPSVADKLFDLDPRAKAALLGAQSVGGVLTGETSFKDAIKTGSGILGSFKGKQEEESSPDISDSEEEKEEEPKEDLKSFIKMFGR